MEKLLGWVKSHLAETIFFALVIVLLGFFALPFLNVSLLNGLTAEGEANYTVYSLSIYQLMGGGVYGEANLMPDVTFILAFLLVMAALIMVIVSIKNMLTSIIPDPQIKLAIQAALVVFFQ